MGKVSKISNIVYLKINKNVLSVIEKWYNFSSDVKHYNKIHLSKYFFVYRGIKLKSSLKKGDFLLHPIPFSTCLDYDNATLWTNSNKYSYILKIKISNNIPFTFTGNLNEGNEVIVSSSNLFIQNIDKNIVECEIIEYYDYNTMIKNFDNIILN